MMNFPSRFFFCVFAQMYQKEEEEDDDCLIIE